MKKMRTQGHFQSGTKANNGKKKAPTPIPAAHAILVEAEKQRRAGNLDKAQSLCQSLLADYPDYVGALQTFGLVHLARQNYWLAMPCFIRSAMESPKDWTNQTNLATIYLGLGATELAAQTLEQARRLHPKDAGIHFGIGEIYRGDREYQLAVAAYTRAIDLESDHAPAILGLGDCYLNLGILEEAAANLMRVHKLRPESAKVLYGLGQLPRSLVKLDIIDALKRVKKQDDDSKEDFRIHVAFAHAAAFDRMGRHQEAWEHLMVANRMEFSKRLKEHSLQLDRRQLVRKAAGDQPVNRGKASSSPASKLPNSLFLLGVSRSGKTTFERLVGALEQAKLGYESHFVEGAVRRASQSAGLVTLKSLFQLPNPLDDQFRRFYIDELREAAAGAGIFTNTNPGLIDSVGRIATSLPEARFIFIKRDRNDVVLRMLMKRYKTGHHYAYDVAAAFDYIAGYDDMIDIWLKKLPTRSICISYEEMIADPAGTLGKVAELCGVSVPDGPLPVLGDDRGCAKPYRELLAAALKRTDQDP